ncbi:hypothetical protein LCGC14_2709350 [marine sediment metagenome]|uniref:Uncharacterized protein n=1 Tax=marine sediment metagenome TaxID=412755 RepID=A0A0F8ZDC1_9ZZZZ
MLTFGTSVAVNNILALRAFYTFIFNYTLHEKPSWIERLWLPDLKKWVAKRAVKTMTGLLNDLNAKSASVSLNDVSGDFFAVLYVVQHPQLIVSVTTGHDLFQLLAQMSLEFEKVRKPTVDTGYEPRKVN